MENTPSLVYFKDLLEKEPREEHLGILLKDETILCLCCGGTVEKEDYKIIKNFNGLSYVEEMLKENFIYEEEEW